MEELVLTIGGLIKSFDWSDVILLLVGLTIVILLVFIVYLINKGDASKEEPLKVKSNSDDIKDIINNLEANYEAKPIDLSEYEQEMENTAIISYDELLEKTSTHITYDDEYDSGTNEVVVKKVDPTNTSLTKEMVDLPKAVMMSYESEEAFLKALKKLQKNLVR